ncbi:MAG: divalent-cation tolerance protein CutA [Betaproteobacteria bacterium]|nr:divalent-cation tolerance protein CutA [Betaproteobacteria bacterium]
MGALLVITTVPDPGLAVKIAESLVHSRLAACVHALPAGLSTYRWQDKVETGAEITLLIKTTAEKYPELEAALRGLHPYQTPEILALPVSAGWPPYLAWIHDATA